MAIVRYLGVFFFAAVGAVLARFVGVHLVSGINADLLTSIGGITAAVTALFTMIFVKSEELSAGKGLDIHHKLALRRKLDSRRRRIFVKIGISFGSALVSTVAGIFLKYAASPLSKGAIAWIYIGYSCILTALFLVVMFGIEYFHLYNLGIKLRDLAEEDEAHHKYLANLKGAKSI